MTDKHDNENGSKLANTGDARLNRLHALLDQTTLYSEFLQKERIKAATERSLAARAARKRKAEGKGSDRGTKRQKAVDEDHLYSPLQDLITGTLRKYQVQGVDWLISLYENGLNGVLADEMGLGKTIQIIAFLAHLRAHGVSGPLMICAPLSTLKQWTNEFAKWAPGIPTLLYHGSKEERVVLRKQLKQEPIPVLVTSYEIAMFDRPYLAKQIHWKMIVVDEGHRLKNFECRLIRDLKQYRSDNRILLTGTPLQNNLRELWSLLNFLLPDIFDSLAKFQSWFDFDEKSMLDQEEKKQILVQEKQNQVISKLHAILRPFMLRRVKRDVELDLPSKREIIIYPALTHAQEVLYEAILAKDRDILPKKFSIQNSVMHLRKVCNHPYLIREPVDSAAQSSTDERIVTCCGKMLLLDKMLRKLKQDGHRVLVFSQMTRVLDILEDYLVMRQYKYCRIDGSVAATDRHSQMDRFNDTESDEFVFLLSTRAGGLGVNLTAADTVIIYDSDWNPTQDSQAQDRCHRIGQQRPVVVYRFITPNFREYESVEMRMMESAQSKQTLEKLVISKGNFKRPRGVALKATDRWKGLVRPLTVEDLMEVFERKSSRSGSARSKKPLQRASSFAEALEETNSGHIKFSAGQWSLLFDRSDEAFSMEGYKKLNEMMDGEAEMVYHTASGMDLS